MKDELCGCGVRFAIFCNKKAKVEAWMEQDFLQTLGLTTAKCEGTQTRLAMVSGQDASCARVTPDLVNVFVYCRIYALSKGLPS